jgi:hypothetical protein
LNKRQARYHPVYGAFALALLILLPFYFLVLQRIPNGAEHYYMLDVGETQTVLNVWGTLHATGYPLYVIVSSALVALLKVFGVKAVVAPAGVSLIYGLIALALIYALAVQLTGKPLLAAGMVVLIGLTRTVWVHQAIAEIYSFGLLFLALLLVIALWKPPIRGRIYWLALVGGLSVFHHRALAMAAPALIYAVWGELAISHQLSAIQRLEAGGWRLVACLLIGLLGFIPYAYLPLRANVGAAWVYGEPNTWQGFWDQFSGREAARFIGAPTTWEGRLANFNLVNTVLVTDLTAPGIIFGLAGLIIALRKAEHRRAAAAFLLSGGFAYGFHVVYYTDILSALILPVVVSIGFGWLFLAEWVLERANHFRFAPRKQASVSEGQSPFSPVMVWLLLVSLVFAAALIGQNLPFIRDLTSNPTGLETIRIANGAPPGSTLMLDWGPRHFAVGVARDVMGELPDVQLVSHKADFKAIVAQGALVTPDFTFYNRQVNWWEEQLGTRVYLRGVAPHLVEIGVTPEVVTELNGTGIQIHEQSLTCSADLLTLKVAWLTVTKPERDLSVFVHLLDGEGNIVAQGDLSAPVFGWRPLTSWQAGEVVRDVYSLRRVVRAERIRFGFYRQLETGAFENVYAFETLVQCDE